jgi:hypothetical protein
MLLKLSLSLLLLPGALLAAPEATLSVEESRLASECTRNIDISAKLFSPDQAETCVTELNATEDLMQRFSQAQSNATLVLLYNNALVSLKKVSSRYSEADLGYAMVRELELRDCYPCSLGLGPRPEKLFSWVDKYLPERSVVFRRSLRTWSALGEARRKTLLAEGLQEESWNALDIRARYAKLSVLAEKDAETLLDAGKKNLVKSPDLVAVVEELKQDLLVNKPQPPKAREQVSALDKLLLDVELLRGEKDPPKAESAAERKALQLKAAEERLAAARGEAGKKGYLDKTFDHSVPGAYIPQPGMLDLVFHPGKYRGVSDADAKAIGAKMASSKDGKFSGYLAKEIGGTKAGDEVLAFFNTPRASGQNKLSFDFEPNKDNNFGTCYYRDTPEIRINTKMINDYARRKGISAEDILGSEKHMAGLAAYIAPVFVHEATHQRQEAVEREKFPLFKDGTYRTVEREVEAFGMGAAFTAEKMQRGGAAYLENSHPHSVRDAELYLEDGLEPLRARKHTYDSYREHFTDEVASARILASSSAKERRAAELRAKYKADPDAMTAEERQTLKEYQDFQKAAYAAARYRSQKAAADERKMLAWRDGMLDEEAGIRPSAVPAPGS